VAGRKLRLGSRKPRPAKATGCRLAEALMSHAIDSSPCWQSPCAPVAEHLWPLSNCVPVPCREIKEPGYFCQVRRSRPHLQWTQRSRQNLDAAIARPMPNEAASETCDSEQQVEAASEQPLEEAGEVLVAPAGTELAARAVALRRSAILLYKRASEEICRSRKSSANSMPSQSAFTKSFSPSRATKRSPTEPRCCGPVCTVPRAGCWKW
jgi:hypothetical protein